MPKKEKITQMPTQQQPASTTATAEAKEPVALLRLDLGAGQNKRQGFTGVDIWEGSDIVWDLFKFPWPFDDNSVEEISMSHFFEHIPAKLRGTLMDEAYRILIDNGKMTVISPYFSSMRAIQDYTHEWPPVCEASFLYFNKGWRDVNKLTHHLYKLKCDFDFNYGYVLDPDTQNRALATQNFWVKHYVQAVMDIQVTLTKRPAVAQ